MKECYKYISLSVFLILTCPQQNSAKLICNNCLKQGEHEFSEKAVSILKAVPCTEVCVHSEGESTPLVAGLDVPVEVWGDVDVTVAGSVTRCQCSVLMVPNLRCDHTITFRHPSSSVSRLILVMVDGPLDLEAAPLPQPCSDLFGPAQVVVLSSGGGPVFYLSSHLTTPRTFSTTPPDEVHPPSNNLYGRPINVATFNCTPFVILDGPDGSGSGTGIEWELIKVLSSYLNFTMNLVQLTGDKRWGALINGSWNGGISRALAEGRADIGVCNIWNTLRYSRIMDFGPPTNVVMFTFIVPRPQLIQHSWQSLVKIFSPQVWLCTLTAFLVSSLCYWRLQNCRHHRISSVKSLLALFGILTLTCWEVKPANSGARQLVSWWCLFVLLLATTYSSSIAAHLALPRYQPRIDTVQQLVQLQFNWYDKNYTTHNKKNIYFNMANDWQRKWEQKYIFIPTNQLKTVLQSRRLALPIQRFDKQVAYISQDGLDYDRDLDDMRILRETTTEMYVSVGFSKHFSLNELFQISLLRLNEAGITEYWSKKIVDSHGEKYAKRLLQETDIVDVGQIKRLGMVNMVPAFYTLYAGLFLSLLILLVEIVKYKLYDKKSQK